MRRRLGWLVALALVVAIAVVALRRRAARPAEAPAWPPLEPLDRTGRPAAGGAGTPAAAAAGSTLTAAVPAPADRPAFVDPVDGACAEGYPVKAKVASGIYHLPGMANYARTVPDRCYASSEAAEADGFRAAKR